MYSNEFDVSGYKVFFEGYGSPEELVDTLKERKATDFSDAWIYDYVNMPENITIPNATWNCFKSPRDLRELVEYGITDCKTLEEVDRFKAATATRTQIARCKPKNAMAGGCVNIGRYLNGAPNCFRSRERMPAPSKVRHIALDVGILGNVEASDVARMGKLIVGAIMATEMRGDRVRLDVCTATMCHDRKVLMMSMNVKKETSRMDLGKFMFWCASPAVNRGVSFNWRATNKNFPESNLRGGMGHSIGYSDMALAKQIYREVFPDGTIILNMMNLLRSTKGMSEDEVVDHIKDLMME